MKKQTVSKTFAEKYGLKGLGKQVRVSKKTNRAVNSLYRLSSEAAQKGKEYADQEIRHFGGCPKPGEPGSEGFFASK
jgi:hypothetical protein